MTMRERLDAMRAGRAAGLAGEPVTSCPHSGDTADGRALRSAWVREWLRARPDVEVSTE